MTRHSSITGKLDLLVIGDSIAYGYALEPRVFDTLNKTLLAMLANPRFEDLNLKVQFAIMGDGDF